MASSWDSTPEVCLFGLDLLGRSVKAVSAEPSLSGSSSVADVWKWVLSSETYISRTFTLTTFQRFIQRRGKILFPGRERWWDKRSKCGLQKGRFGNERIPFSFGVTNKFSIWKMFEELFNVGLRANYRVHLTPQKKPTLAFFVFRWRYLRSFFSDNESKAESHDPFTPPTHNPQRTSFNILGLKNSQWCHWSRWPWITDYSNS